LPENAFCFSIHRIRGLIQSFPKSFSDDLRCRILDAYERKEGSQQELALGVTQIRP
jgi:hypothetical protein